MFEETIRKFFKGQPNIFKADFLADNIERHCRITPVHGSHDARQHRSVAHARVEQAQRGWMWRDVVEFHGHSIRNGPLFTAGVDEHQVFLPIVKESKVRLAFSVGRTRGVWLGGWV